MFSLQVAGLPGRRYLLIRQVETTTFQTRERSNGERAPIRRDFLGDSVLRTLDSEGYREMMTDQDKGLRKGEYTQGKSRESTRSTGRRRNCKFTVIHPARFETCTEYLLGARLPHVLGI